MLHVACVWTMKVTLTDRDRDVDVLYEYMVLVAHVRHDDCGTMTTGCTVK